MSHFGILSCHQLRIQLALPYALSLIHNAPFPQHKHCVMHLMMEMGDDDKGG
jgi:hypothetical protein